MILLVLSLAQLALSALDAHDFTDDEQRYCADDPGDQGFRFCLADQKHQRAEQTLFNAVARTRQGANAQGARIAQFRRQSGNPTLKGDPERVLRSAQIGWEKSFKADCWAAGLAVATGSNGTEGVVENWNCEADRMLDRAQFLGQLYRTEG